MNKIIVTLMSLFLLFSMPAIARTVEKVNHKAELKCLADMAYTEAGIEGERGVKAVVDVMFNRLEHKAFKNTVCGNFYMKNQYEGSKYVNRRKNMDLYNKIQKQVAREYVLYHIGAWKDSTRGSLFFNATGKPATRRVALSHKLGRHYFYIIKV